MDVQSRGQRGSGCVPLGGRVANIAAPGGTRGGRRGGDVDLPGKCPPGSRNLVQVRGQVFMPPSHDGGICRKMGDEGPRQLGGSRGRELEGWKLGLQTGERLRGELCRGEGCRWGAGVRCQGERATRHVHPLPQAGSLRRGEQRGKVVSVGSPWRNEDEAGFPAGSTEDEIRVSELEEISAQAATG